MDAARDLIPSRPAPCLPPGRLQPKLPPGQRSRKARQFGVEIGRLHAEGYSIDTIRETLAEAGLVVSWSTVQREAARQARTAQPRSIAKPPPNSTASPLRRPIDGASTLNAPAAEALLLSGKAVAEAFFQAHNANPLLRKGPR